MPHRLIGRTAGFGPVSRGSSPRGATRKKVRTNVRTFFMPVFFWPGELQIRLRLDHS